LQPAPLYPGNPFSNPLGIFHDEPSIIFIASNLFNTSILILLLSSLAILKKKEKTSERKAGAYSLKRFCIPALEILLVKFSEMALKVMVVDVNDPKVSVKKNSKASNFPFLWMKPLFLAIFLIFPFLKKILNGFYINRNTFIHNILPLKNIVKILGYRIFHNLSSF
jgi:hypothetical protein